MEGVRERKQGRMRDGEGERERGKEREGERGRERERKGERGTERYIIPIELQRFE